MAHHSIDRSEVFTYVQWDDSIDAMRDCIAKHLDNGWKVARNYGPYTFMYWPKDELTLTLGVNWSEMIAITIGGHVAILKTKEEDCLPAWIDGDSC